MRPRREICAMRVAQRSGRGEDEEKYDEEFGGIWEAFDKTESRYFLAIDPDGTLGTEELLEKLETGLEQGKFRLQI